MRMSFFLRNTLFVSAISLFSDGIFLFLFPTRTFSTSTRAVNSPVKCNMWVLRPQWCLGPTETLHWIEMHGLKNRPTWPGARAVWTRGKYLGLASGPASSTPASFFDFKLRTEQYENRTGPGGGFLNWSFCFRAPPPPKKTGRIVKLLALEKMPFSWHTLVVQALAENFPLPPKILPWFFWAFDDLGKKSETAEKFPQPSEGPRKWWRGGMMKWQTFYGRKWKFLVQRKGGKRGANTQTHFL